ncbi:MAG: SAM-dependent methyltransferase [Bacteroidetes bacterium 4484_276]|nr:MAG: SAM-dependent methyltransferase [Bacteroidetes bacterium 4484_276]OYT13545.1 MAG: SAM-dependent methyltransferase [Bacteroidetes bacterium 4572_114]
MLKPALYLIPVGLGGGNPGEILPGHNSKIIQEIDEFIVENARSARRFLKSIGYSKNFDDVTFHILDKHTPEGSIPEFISSIKLGKPVGLLSEAGVPCVADPGNIPVILCQEKGFKVVPLVGPSSIILALMASGFNGQNFSFHGYLPVEKGDLKRKIKEIESLAYKQNQTQIFIETPFRNNKMLSALISTCSAQTKLCIATNLTLNDESILTKSIHEWKTVKVDLNKKPSVFLIYKN